MQRILETARGRWHGILPQLGISPKLLRNRHGPCPMCGGKDRFRFDNKEGKGTWICNKCGSGDGAELVKRVKGVDFKEAAKMIEGVIHNAAKRAPQPMYGASKQELNSMWSEASSIGPCDPVGVYLRERCGLRHPFPGALRRYGSVMIARALGGNFNGDWDIPFTEHRTWIEKGEAVERRMMPGKLPDNVAIRLFGFRDNSFLGAGLGTLGIAEGIETALSASVLFDVPVWAAISAPLLKKWRPPMGVQKVIIFGDNDENFTGQEAAYSLARALSGDVKVEVKIPSIPGWDWNDVQRNNNRNL
jgi:putative DNA primase/helicase